MYQDNQNERLRLTCPHCRHEYVVIGVNVDTLRDCSCNKCKAVCDIHAIDRKELTIWLRNNDYGGEYID